MPVMAGITSSAGGPDNSTAPPGSTVIRLLPGRSPTSAMIARDLIPFGAAGRVGEIEAVRLDLQADAADRAIGQACLR